MRVYLLLMVAVLDSQLHEDCPLGVTIHFPKVACCYLKGGATAMCNNRH